MIHQPFYQQPEGHVQPHQPELPHPHEHGSDGHNTAKKLTKKFKGLMSRSRSSSCSSSSSSSSSSSDSDSSKKKKKNKKKNKEQKKKKRTFATKPYSDPRYGPHPFSIFCPSQDGAHIVLTLTTASGGEARDLLVGPRHDASQPAFRIDRSSSGLRVYRFDLPDLDPRRPVLAGEIAAKKGDGGGGGGGGNRRFFEFAWGAWDFDAEGEVWQSDVGLCGETNWMRWCMIKGPDEDGRRFVARCFDTTQRGMPTVASFEMDDGDRGTLEIVAGIVRTVEQLDELVVMSYAMMDQMRDRL